MMNSYFQFEILNKLQFQHLSKPFVHIHFVNVNNLKKLIFQIIHYLKQSIQMHFQNHQLKKSLYHQMLKKSAILLFVNAKILKK